MKQKTSYFSTLDLISVACMVSLGASLGRRAGQATFELGVDLCELGLDRLKKKFETKAEKKEEE